MPGNLRVHIVAPEREVWAGDATMVIARGTEGEVGIMTGHAPMLIRLAVGTLRVQHDGTEQRAVVDGGFLHVTNDEGGTRVDILADGADLEGEIDFEAAERTRLEAERRLQEEDDERVRADLEAALARLNLRQ